MKKKNRYSENDFKKLRRKFTEMRNTHMAYSIVAWYRYTTPYSTTALNIKGCCISVSSDYGYFILIHMAARIPDDFLYDGFEKCTLMIIAASPKGQCVDIR